MSQEDKKIEDKRVVYAPGNVLDLLFLKLNSIVRQE
jgi:hypothetical protein